jgi:NHL repeat
MITAGSVNGVRRRFMQLLRLSGWIACLPLALVLASCAGGSAPSAVPASSNVTNPGSPGVSKAVGVVPASFTFVIPLPSSHAATQSRKPQYLSATAQSLEIAIVLVNGTTPAPAPSPTIANVSSTAPGCTTASGDYTCTVTLGLPIGSDTVLVKAFDGVSATGNLLSQQQSIFTVAQGSANSFSMTLDAVPGPIVLTQTSGPACSGSPLTCAISGTSALNFTLTVADTHGTPLANNTIAGSPVLSAMSSDTTIASVTARQNPYGITLTPVGSGTATITVTATSATSTSGLSPTSVTFTVTVTIVSLQEPVGVAVDVSGNIYVANLGNNTVTKYAASGGAPTLTITTDLSFPYGVAVDASGNIYVANYDNNTVTKYAPGGGAPTLTISSGLSVPPGVAVDASGNIYVANLGNNTVTKYGVAGGSPILTIH